MVHTAKVLVKIICNSIEHKIGKQLSNNQFGLKKKNKKQISNLGLKNTGRKANRI